MHNIINYLVPTYLTTASFAEIEGPHRGFTKKSIDAAREDVAKFVSLVVLEFGVEVGNKLLDLNDNQGHYYTAADFWYCRQHHGVGFTDRDMYNEIASNADNRLTKIANSFTERCVFKLKNNYLIIE